MRLIGMLDSPYVRRVAISLDVLQIPFTHEAVSVFRDFAKFGAINPVVKAPTLICDDGEVLMDSSLILQFAETLQDKRSLWSDELKERQNQFRMVGLALAACDKSVQLIYERNLRPEEFQYQPWMARVSAQLRAAYMELEKEIQKKARDWALVIHQPAISVAVAWQLTQSLLPGLLPQNEFPAVAGLADTMENTDLFRRYPPAGPGVSVKPSSEID